MKKQLHFMSGVPRSGSTVLAAILNQNKQTHVSTTSGLVFAIDGMVNTWSGTGLLRADEKNHKILVDSVRGTIDAFYEEFDAPVVIDKGRGWPIPQVMQAMTEVGELNLKSLLLCVLYLTAWPLLCV